MIPDPPPDPGHDDQEPDGAEYPPAPDAGEQGLFVCLPAEQLDVTGFAQDGQADTMPPGPLLTTVMHALVGQDGEGLAGLSDDQLMGIIAATRRLESRIAWTQMSAVRELATRRAAGPAGRREFAADELADELHLAWRSAADHIDYVCVVGDRLPRTFAALAAGLIHAVHVRIIEDETSVLSPEDAAKADEILAVAAQGKTFGELRYAAHKLVLKLDPESAQRRKEAAKKDAHVRPFREQSGNAGMIARQLPSDEVLASWQHVEQRALDLRATGMPGTLQELRVRAYLDLLQERDSRDVPGDPDHDQASSPPGPDNGQAGSQPDPAPAGDGATVAGKGPSLAALVNITVPWSTAVGRSDTPADVAGLGLVDAQTARDLVAAAARDPRTRWCVTVLYPDGTAAAHGCASGRHPPPRFGGGQHAAEYLRGMKITFRPVIRGPCDHSQAERTYRPSRKLQHLVRVRNACCTAPGCRRPAARCDLDHTEPWHQGGMTCPCDLAPLCRHHHRCKQAEGWWLEMPEPGVLVWRTPSGRSYITTPTEYPI